MFQPYGEVEVALKGIKNELTGHKKVFAGRKTPILFLKIKHVAAPIRLRNKGCVRGESLNKKLWKRPIGLSGDAMGNDFHRRMDSGVFMSEGVKASIS